MEDTIRIPADPRTLLLCASGLVVIALGIVLMILSLRTRNNRRRDHRK